MNKILFLCIAFGTVLSINLYAQEVPQHPIHVPLDWYNLPEDNAFVLNPNYFKNNQTQSEENIDLLVDKIYLINEKSSQSLSIPKDGTPWHLEYFTTDLSVTAQGLIGVLTAKGTTSVSAFWRHQGKAPISPTEIAPSHSPLTVRFNENANTQSLIEQIEPAIQAALSTGQVQDEQNLRKNIAFAATQFQDFIQVLDQENQNQWWVSGFRIDFSIEASGKIVPIGVTVGGELRFRFEWKRMEKKSSLTKTLSTPLNHHQLSLKDFVNTMEQSLDEASALKLEQKGFAPQSFRVGIGISVSGDIGIAKGSGSVLGHLNFSRDVNKPIVYPIKKSNLLKNSNILIIENSAPISHHLFANANKINFTKQGEQTLYEADLDQFKKGLHKAMNLGLHFTGKKNNSSKNSQSGWKIYELKVGFDMSISGSMGLVTYAGLAAADFCFLNQNF